MMMQLPDFCETTIRRPSYFSFLLPVTAFGFEDDMVMEVSVEYFLSEETAQYRANVWARQNKALTKGFILPLAVPVCDDPESAIFEALNTDEGFDAIMRDFICAAAKNRCD